MAADPRDDFSIFEGSGHMFYGLSDPLALLRLEVERSLQAQVAETQVDSITAFDEPRFLTLGVRLPEDPNKVRVAHFAVCCRAWIEARGPGHSERLPATLSLFLKHVDRHGEEKMRFTLDLHQDAEAGYDAALFERRFLEFRNEA